MKFLNLGIIIILLVLINACDFKKINSKPQNASIMSSENAKSFYDFKLKSLDESEEISFEKYKGKKVLLVNVASKCGFTPQYEGLQKLHEEYGNNVVILGFPSNEFGGQEPGTKEDIATFCQKNYGVTFQMFEKIKVKKGEGQHPLYQWLSSKSENGWNDDAPNWNFCKYFVNEKGELEKFFASAIKPMGNEILALVK